MLVNLADNALPTVDPSLPSTVDPTPPSSIDPTPPSIIDPTPPAVDFTDFGSFEDPPYVEEESMEDAIPRNMAVDEHAPPIEYERIESSQRGHMKLVDSIGYSYSVKRKYGEDNIVWRCTVHNKTTSCLATVRQHGTTYTSGLQIHSHQPLPGIGTPAKVHICIHY